MLTHTGLWRILSFRTFSILILIEVVDALSDAYLHQLGYAILPLWVHIEKIGIGFLLALPLLIYWFTKDFGRLKFTQTELSDSEQNYSSLFEHNPDAVYLLDLDGQCLEANQAFHTIMGYTIEELYENGSFSLASGQNREVVREHFFHATQGEWQRYEVTVVNKNAEKLELDVTYFPMYKNSRVVGVCGIAKDITKRKRADQELMSAHNLLNSFLGNTTDAIAFLDGGQKITWVNQGFEALYGWKSEELIDQSIQLLVPENMILAAEEVIQVVLSGGVVTSVETVRQRKDTSLIDVNLTVSPIRDCSGNVTGIVSVSRDISLRKKMGRELEETKRRLESFVTHTADAISFIDNDNLRVFVNPAWENLYGWASNEVIGKPAGSSIERRKTSESLAGPQVVSMETVIQRKDGTEVQIHLTKSPIYCENGNLIGMSVISRDISQIKQHEDLVIRTEKLALAGELAAGIAHEIRNPLTAIQGFLQLMRIQFKPEYLDIILREVVRIDDITTEFMILSRPQSENYENVEMGPLVDEVVKLMTPQSILYNVRMEKNVTKGLTCTRCVKNQLKQVLINIIKNSIEVMNEGGTIRITVHSTPVGLRISIVDDGPGIPTDMLPFLGQPFYTTKERGAGLGLMVTYRIIQSHNGSIHVHSKPGKGTEFEIVIPAEHRK